MVVSSTPALIPAWLAFVKQRKQRVPIHPQRCHHSLVWNSRLGLGVFFFARKSKRQNITQQPQRHTHLKFTTRVTFDESPETSNAEIALVVTGIHDGEDRGGELAARPTRNTTTTTTRMCDRAEFAMLHAEHAEFVGGGAEFVGGGCEIILVLLAALLRPSCPCQRKFYLLPHLLYISVV